MGGASLAARLNRVPVLLDGFIACAAIAPLVAAKPGFTDHCLAAHCSAEAGHVRLLERVGLEPLLHLGMRLGEGSGAAVAVHEIGRASCRARGCRYVESQGVAVSLKKKRK